MHDTLWSRSSVSQRKAAILAAEKARGTHLGTIKGYVSAKYSLGATQVNVKELIKLQKESLIKKINLKVLHKTLFSSLDNPHIDVSSSSTWLKYGNNSPRSEGLFSYLQDRNFFNGQRKQCNHCKKFQSFAYSIENAELACILTNPLKRSAPTVTSRKLVIPFEEFKITTTLGQGNFGKVYKGFLFWLFIGKWKNLDVALKSLKDANNKEFFDEAKIMHSLDNQYLVKLLGVSLDGETSYLCMEFMERGHLMGVLKSDRGNKITFEMLARMAAQVIIT
ncbi:tyrosine-protein kinase HCK-like [Octopus sinensis]|uniref:Tyrosine-protein kinase HCK-like n=1 Tax=Octopus sinensis TaxID=2607531 RepID=A0A6P7U1G7_9MOLL|nr:tyrosine-protein kinase HCK-like [Octopus sinensis]